MKKQVIVKLMTLLFLVSVVSIGFADESAVQDGKNEFKPIDTMGAPERPKKKEKKVTKTEAHQFFAISLNNRTWELLGKKKRTSEENREMIQCAQTSCYHWRFVGKPVNQQRGEWLITRVYCELGMGEAALYHAQLCKQFTDKYMDEMKDFDQAYSWEAMARAYAVSGDLTNASECLEKARKAGDLIKDAEDKKLFLGDLKSGKWYGVKP